MDDRVPVSEGGLSRLATVLLVLAIHPAHQVKRFPGERRTWERLRDLISVEPTCRQVWVDHYEWTEACDWPSGCGRWVDGPPSPETLARICAMPVERAREYISGLNWIGALRLSREDDEIEFDLEFSGLVTAGSTRSIVWRARPPAELHHERDAWHGVDYRPLGDGWYEKLEWD